MSERRSTEIKFRTTPSFKARVQAAAAAAGKSMSEFLEECAEMRMWADANQKLDGTALVGNAIALLATRDTTPQPNVDVATFGDSTPEPKGWMFEARK